MVYLTAEQLENEYLRHQRAASPGATTIGLWENKAGDTGPDGVRAWTGSALVSGDRALIVYASLGSTPQRALLGKRLDLELVERIADSLNAATGGVDLATLYERLHPLKN